jgi:lipid-binding SYLF domain-containing protein
MKFRPINTLIGVLCLSLVLGIIGLAQSSEYWRREQYRREQLQREAWRYGGSSKDVADASNQAYKAARVFRDIMYIPENGIPQSILEKAYCVAVFPSVIKAGFVFGGRYGRGVASCRTKVGWSAPAFFYLGGGSFGLQIGAQATDFILLFMSDNGMRNLLRSRFEIGGDASAAAGPVGRTMGAGVDLTLRSQILTYSKSRGLFAGLELKGTVVSQDKDDNQAIYGPYVGPDGILKAVKPPPSSVRIYPNTLGYFSPRRER